MLRVQRCVDAARMRDRLEHAETELAGAPSAGAAAVRADAGGPRHARRGSPPRRAARCCSSGETGVGKEVLARELHRLRRRRDGAVRARELRRACPRRPSRASSSATRRAPSPTRAATRRGLVEIANGGTLFLDEIGELPLPLQAKLLTFLDAGRFRRLGGTSEQTSTARIVGGDQSRPPGRRRARAASAKTSGSGSRSSASTCRRCASAPRGRAAAGRGHPATRLGAELGRRGVVLGARARERLLRYPFPGNVRELRNVLERAIVLEPGPELELRPPGRSPAASGRAGCIHGGRRGDPDGRARAALRPLGAGTPGRPTHGGRQGPRAVVPTFLKRLGED